MAISWGRKPKQKTEGEKWTLRDSVTKQTATQSLLARTENLKQKKKSRASWGKGVSNAYQHVANIRHQLYQLLGLKTRHIRHDFYLV